MRESLSAQPKHELGDFRQRHYHDCHIAGCLQGGAVTRFDEPLTTDSGWPSMDYTVLSLADVRNGLDDIARETQATFGGFDGRQLNWRPDETRWSVAQCFEHLLTANRLMFLAGGRPESCAAAYRLAAPAGPTGRLRTNADSLTGTELGAEVHGTV